MEPDANARLFDILHHDIVNPLGIIKNFSDLVSDDAPEAIKPQLDAIIRNADRLIEIVEDVRLLGELSRIKSLQFDKLELTGLMKDAIEGLEEQKDKRRIRIKFDQPGEIPIKASVYLGNVFSNLLSNAVKYSPEGREVTIEITDLDKDVVVSFRDSGPGVRDEHKQSIFERLERTKKEGVKGTGLGLAVAKRIMELHKGRVWVEDNPAGGSIFKVQVPKDLK